jgi:RNA polymerase sigma-70 factor, ECF subfamily
MSTLEAQAERQVQDKVPVAARSSFSSTPEDLAMGRFADGDEHAFGEVFAALVARLHAFLRRLCGSDELARDLTQETFLRMHRARASFAPNGAVVPWAYAIARNCYVSHTRSRQAKAWRNSVAIDGKEFATGLDACVEEAASAQQRARIVEQTLAAMSPANREAFVLVRFEGQSIAEAAQILGTTEGAVKQRAFQAYERLREALSHS